MWCTKSCPETAPHRDDRRLEDPTNFLTSANEGNFRTLLRFRAEAGGVPSTSFQNYIRDAPGNALYLSVL